MYVCFKLVWAAKIKIQDKTECGKKRESFDTLAFHIYGRPRAKSPNSFVFSLSLLNSFRISNLLEMLTLWSQNNINIVHDLAWTIDYFGISIYHAVKLTMQIHLETQLWWKHSSFLLIVLLLLLIFQMVAKL